jgi:hypothetical protein
MQFTPIPNVESHFMGDTVSVFKQCKNGKMKYIRPYYRKETREFYVKMTLGGKRFARSIKTLVTLTYPSEETVAIPETRFRLPDFPLYTFWTNWTDVRVFKGTKEVKRWYRGNRESNRFSVTNWEGKRTTLLESDAVQRLVNFSHLPI